MTATVHSDRVTAVLEKFGALIGHATELDPSDRAALGLLARLITVCLAFSNEA